MRVNPPKILLILSAVALHLATVSAQATQRPKTWTRATGAAPAPPPAPLPKATITRLGVGGPVTGGQNSFGLVELSEPAPAAGVTIQLSSDNPAIVVPATVTVAPGASDQSFTVTTAPVASSTTVTVSARTAAGATAQTATVTVVPPSLSFVSCTPQTVPAGTSTTCKVQLNAPVATPSLGPEGDSRVQRGPAQLAITIQLAAGNPAHVQPKVEIGAGQRSKSFTVWTSPIAQSASTTISASHGGATKGTTLYVTATSIKYFHCGITSSGGPANSSPCTHVPRYAGGGWSHVWGKIGLTAPAPEGGLVVKLSDDPNLVTFTSTNSESGIDHVRISAGRSEGSFWIRPRAVASETPVTISVFAPLSGETRTRTITVRAPAVKRLFVPGPDTILGVPIGGTKVDMVVELTGSAANGGLPLSFGYSGTTDITGPGVVKIPERGVQANFQVTVSPCSVNPPCIVQAKTGSHTATLTVKP